MKQEYLNEFNPLPRKYFQIHMPHLMTPLHLMFNVLEYRAEHPRSFPSTKSIQIIQGPRSSLVHFPLQLNLWVFNGGSVMGLR